MVQPQPRREGGRHVFNRGTFHSEESTRKRWSLPSWWAATFAVGKPARDGGFHHRLALCLGPRRFGSKNPPGTAGSTSLHFAGASTQGPTSNQNGAKRSRPAILTSLQI